MTAPKPTVMMLTWEFPPRIIGGISTHVNDLSIALTQNGANVYVVTCDFPGAPDFEHVGGINVYRFNSKIPAYSFLQWIFSMNQAMAEKASEVIKLTDERIDLIHAHDWLVANAAMKTAGTFEKSLVTTIHATEVGRRGGIHNDYQQTINEVENQLIRQSSEVICCSNYMAKQITETFGTAKNKLFVIRNGVNAARFEVQSNSSSLKRKYAGHGEKIVLYVGRLVYEKGVHVLLGAVPKVLSEIPEVNFVIVGEGGMKEYLIKEAWDFGIADHVHFTGFVDEKTLVTLYRSSDVAVFPSLYEPFGITVLEAMAARTPAIVTDTGGLAEIIDHGKTGVKVYVDNSDSLAWGILRILKDPSLASKIRENAYRKVIREFNWTKIANETMSVYRKALATGPSRASKLNLSLAFSRLKDYSEEMRILVLLHVLGAADSDRAMLTLELADILGMSTARLRGQLQKLLQMGYVISILDGLHRVRYYLTKQGIIKACTLFS